MADHTTWLLWGIGKQAVKTHYLDTFTRHLDAHVCIGPHLPILHGLWHKAPWFTRVLGSGPADWVWLRHHEGCLHANASACAPDTVVQPVLG